MPKRPGKKNPNARKNPVKVASKKAASKKPAVKVAGATVKKRPKPKKGQA